MKKIISIITVVIFSVQLFGYANVSAEEKQVSLSPSVSRKPYYSEVKINYPNYKVTDTLFFSAVKTAVGDFETFEDEGILFDSSKPEISFKLNVPKSGIYNILIMNSSCF